MDMKSGLVTWFSWWQYSENLPTPSDMTNYKTWIQQSCFMLIQKWNHQHPQEVRRRHVCWVIILSIWRIAANGQRCTRAGHGGVSVGNLGLRCPWFRLDLLWWELTFVGCKHMAKNHGTTPTNCTQNCSCSNHRTHFGGTFPTGPSHKGFDWGSHQSKLDSLVNKQMYFQTKNHRFLWPSGKHTSWFCRDPPLHLHQSFTSIGRSALVPTSHLRKQMIWWFCVPKADQNAFLV